MKELSNWIPALGDSRIFPCVPLDLVPVNTRHKQYEWVQFRRDLPYFVHSCTSNMSKQDKPPFGWRDVRMALAPGLGALSLLLNPCRLNESAIRFVVQPLPASKRVVFYRHI